jgi:hypothetical protein
VSVSVGGVAAVAVVFSVAANLNALPA